MNPRTAAILNTCQAFGLTKQAAVKLAKETTPIDFGGSFDPVEDAKGVVTHSAASVIPWGPAALGAYLAEARGASPIAGAIRAYGGAVAGGLLGGSAGYGLGSLTGMNDVGEIASTTLGTIAGAGLGGHLATRKYWVPREAKSEE